MRKISRTRPRCGPRQTQGPVRVKSISDVGLLRAATDATRPGHTARGDSADNEAPAVRPTLSGHSDRLSTHDIPAAPGSVILAVVKPYLLYTLRCVR